MRRGRAGAPASPAARSAGSACTSTASTPLERVHSAPAATTRPAPVLPVQEAVRVGLPCELLRGRRAIRGAGRQCGASSEELGGASGGLFRRVSRNGLFGVKGADLASVFEYASRYYSLGPSV